MTKILLLPHSFECGCLRQKQTQLGCMCSAMPPGVRTAEVLGRNPDQSGDISTSAQPRFHIFFVFTKNRDSESSAPPAKRFCRVNRSVWGCEPPTDGSKVCSEGGAVHQANSATPGQEKKTKKKMEEDDTFYLAKI